MIVILLFTSFPLIGQGALVSICHFVQKIWDNLCSEVSVQHLIGLTVGEGALQRIQSSHKGFTSSARHRGLPEESRASLVLSADRMAILGLC